MTMTAERVARARAAVDRPARVRPRASSLPAAHGDTEITRRVRPAASAPASRGRTAPLERRFGTPARSMDERVAAARAAVLRPAALRPRADSMPSIPLSLGEPTQIVWSLIGKTATYRLNTAGGGGGGLPTGWTQDADDPSNVFTNGEGSIGTGALIVGIENANEQVQIESTGIGAVDDAGNEYFVAGATGVHVQPVLGGGGPAIVISGVLGADAAIDAGALPITDLADPTNAQDAATKAYVDGHTPATPNLSAVLTAGAAAGNKKITGLAPGTQAGDSVRFEQIPTALPPNGAAGGDLSGTYPNPAVAASAITVAKLAAAVTLDAVATAHATAADVAMNSHKITGLAAGVNPADAVRFDQLPGASALVLLQRITLAVDGVIDFTGIPTGYTDLFLSGMIRGTDAGSTDTLELHVNNDSGTNYSYQQAVQADAAWTVFGGAASTVVDLADHGIPSAGSNAAMWAGIEMTVFGYLSTLWRKMIKATIASPTGTHGNESLTVGTWTPTPAAVTRLTLFGGFTNALKAGSSVALYGRL